MGKQATLTRHAISPPAFEGGKLHRERLVDALHANIPRRLIAVIAPAGYGKTTLLADFASHTELPVCWLKLTEGDRDPMRMAGVLQASLTSRFRRLRRTLRVAAMAGADESAVAMAFAHAIRNAVEEPFVLIVDDVHLVNDSPSVMGFWKAFLENQPEQVTLVMAGREVPNLPLEALLERGQVAGVGPLELALTPGELRELSRQAFGKDIGEEDLERLQRETGGWVMGVLLSGAVPVSGLGVLVQSQRPMVYDYLAAVVLNRQPRALREFLLQSAVLPVMTAEGCDEVLRRSDSGRVLLQAMRGGMFLSSTGERPKTYEYHPQFREFLLATLLEEDPSQLRRLRVRAGGFLARQGSIEAAVDLYLEAGDTKRAGRLAERHARAIRRAGKLETLERWRGRLKGEERAYVALGIQLGVGLADRGRISDARGILSICARKAEERGWHQHSSGAYSGLALTAWHKGSLTAVDQYAGKALAFSRLQRNVLVKADALRWISVSRTFSAKGATPLRFINQAIAIASKGEDSYGMGILLADKVLVALELGDDAALADALGTFRRMSGGPGHAWLGPMVIRQLGFADIIGGDYFSALQKLEQAAELAFGHGNPREFAISTAMRAYYLAVGGQLAESVRILEEMPQRAEAHQSSLVQWLAPVVMLIILRWSGRHREAQLLAERTRKLLGGSRIPPWAEHELLVAEFASEPHKLCRLLDKHIAAVKAGYPREDRVRALWLLARSYDRGEEAAKASSLFQNALAEAISPSAICSLAEEAYREQMLFRRLSTSSSNVREISKVKERFHWIKNYELSLERSMSLKQNSNNIKIAAFGRVPEITWGKEQIELRPLDRELFVLIATERDVEADVICEEFWQGRPRGAQTANLHSAIYRLRTKLGGGAIVRTSNGYQLSDTIELDYDLLDFKRTLMRVRVSGKSPSNELLDVVNGVVGSYEGFMTTSQSAWASRRRVELDTEFAELAEWCARMYVDRGEDEASMRVVEKGLLIDPYSEGLNGLALETLAKAGKLHELGITYQRYVTHLREELGLDPPRAIREKYSQLLMAATA